MKTNHVLRWLPASTMMLVSIVSYIDRNTLALLSPTILKELSLNNEQYGYIISAFSMAYMVSNPIWGRILDRIGLRIGMAIAVALWTMASVSHVFAAGLTGLMLARILLGLGEGATFPGCLRTVVQTLPIEYRSRGVALAYSGGSLGALITPVIITPIAVAWGWESAFWFTGLVGLTWLIIWFFVSRRDDLGVKHHAPSVQTYDLSLFSNRIIWAFIAIDALGAFPSALINYYSANYLHTALGKEQIEIGRIMWIPPLGWEIGYFFWAWITDRFAASGRSIPALRRVFLVLTILSLTFVVVPKLQVYALVVSMMFLVMFVAAGFIIAATAYATSHISAGHSGLIAGLGAGSSGLIVALTMPIIGRLFDLHLYAETFLMVSLFPVAGFVIWLVLNRKTAAAGGQAGAVTAAP